jgi:mono/diheme cytochrome c family protein
VRRPALLGGLVLMAGIAVTAALAASGGGDKAAASQATRSAAIDPHVAMGAHLFVQFACSSCHGPQGAGGVSKYVPALKSIGNKLTVKSLTTIITKGLGESENPKRPFMPVWGPVISKSQVADLVAYIRAGLPKVKYATPVPVPRDQGPAVAGQALYVRYGCINCHGPSGLGGVPNPQAEDKTIPPLAGQEFREEFNTDKKIIDFIRSGSVIGKPPITSMPHWGGIIPNRDLQALVAYLKTLK